MTQAFAEGAYLAQWRYKESELAKMPKHIEPISGAKDAWIAGLNVAKAQNFARYLMEAPANLMTPTIFCETVTAKLQPLGVKCKTFGKTFIDTERMGAFWSVAKGSIEEPKMLKLEYNGATKQNEKCICLVGKGVTFDAGGISIKVKKQIFRFDNFSLLFGNFFLRTQIYFARLIFMTFIFIAYN